MSAIQSQTRERRKKPCNFDQKIPMKILSHYYFLQKQFTILGRFAKPFPTKRKPSKCPTEEKKWGKKSKRSGEERKQKAKDERAAKLSRKNTLEILLSAHARTLKAAIWHQEQKLVQCSTCKQSFGQFGFFLARQRPKNGLTRFKRHFLAKFPGVNGLIKTLSRSRIRKQEQSLFCLLSK